MTFKGTLAVGVALLAIWLFVHGQTSTAAPVHRPAVHAPAHRPAAKPVKR
jgi:hypothetical protein